MQYASCIMATVGARPSSVATGFLTSELKLIRRMDSSRIGCMFEAKKESCSGSISIGRCAACVELPGGPVLTVVVEDIV